MKKVYIPSKDELYKLQSMGANIYKYLLIRTIEAIIIEDVLYEEHDMLEFVYDELSEFPEIIQAIGKLYPERIPNCKRAIHDIELCKSIITKLPEKNKAIYGLDNLVYYNDNPSVLFNSEIVLNTIEQLAKQLSHNPKYRFDYKEPNSLLDDIFACEISMSSISRESIDDLSLVDPIYSIKLNNQTNLEDKKIRDSIVSSLTRNIIIYGNRYGLDRNIGMEYQRKDILKNPDNRVKKLIRTLEYHKNNYQQ